MADPSGSGTPPRAGPSDPTLPYAPGQAPAPAATSRFGKFVRTQRIGAGGMGEVWKAWDEGLSRWVALKFLKGGSDDEIARFEREARTAGGLSHPHIAAIHEIGREGGQHYIAMQFIDGTTLKALPRGNRKALVKLVRDAATAVHFAHEQGIVHRDLKPDNLMVASGHLYVMDFGLARPAEGASDLSVSGQAVGTPAYMPPEQARGERADARSDVYSLGATLYELLSDRRPFGGKNVMETLRLLQDDEPRAPRTIDPSIDADLETIVLKCLEKDRDRRYASARDLADDLGRWLEGEPVLARPASLLYKVRKSLGRRKAVVAVAAAGLAALALSLGILVPKWDAERRGREAIQELGPLWTRIATVREWTRQPHKTIGEIRAEFEAVDRQLGEFLGRHPRLPQGWYVRARERDFRGETEGALRDLDEAVRLAPDYGPAWSLIGRIRLQKYQFYVYDAPMNPELLTAGTTEVLKNAQEALARGADPGSEAEAARRWGLSETGEEEVSRTIAAALREFLVEKREDAALDRLRRAQERRSSEDFARTLGILSRDWAEKIRCFDLAIEIAPHQAAVRFDRGMALLNHGDLARAIQDFDRALAISDGQALVYYGRGTARRKQGDLDGAILDLTQAIRHLPTLVQAHNNRGYARQLKGDLKGAIEDYSRAMDIQPKVAAFRYNRGLARALAGDPEGAIADFTEVIGARPDFADAWADRANLRAAGGAPKEALADYAKAIELDPGNWKHWYNRALARWSAGDRSGIRGDLDRSLDLNPRCAPAWSRRGMVRLKEGDAKGAAGDFTRAIELDPRDPQNFANRGQIRKDEGDLEGARADFRRALEIAEESWDQREEVERVLQHMERSREH